MKLMHACLGSGENRFVASAEISSAVLPASPSFSVLLFEVRMAFESGPAAASESARFLVKTDEDVLHLLENAVPQNTRKSTDMWVGILASFCSERKIDFDLSTCSAQELNDVLCKFYPGLRTKKGELYKKSSYFAARAAVHRKVQELGRPFNLFKSVEFLQSHRVLDATLKVKKLDGEEPSVRHKASLTQEDLSRLEAYFSDVLQANDPIKLTEFVWYVITLHCGLRAREIQVQLRKSDLEFRSDDSGDYFVLNKDFASKNCQGGTKGREFETIGRVQNAHQVKALRIFLSKLNPGVERLFQRARMGFVEEEDATWFQRQVLGKNLLGTMMERISRHANLSQRYTNHCVRATAVTILKKNGVEDSTVCLLTGHKNERSLRSYSKPDASKCRELARCLDGHSPGEGETSAATVTSSSAAAKNVFSRTLVEKKEAVEDQIPAVQIVANGAVFHNLAITVHQREESRPAPKKRKLSLTRSETSVTKKSRVCSSQQAQP